MLIKYENGWWIDNLHEFSSNPEIAFDYEKTDSEKTVPARFKGRLLSISLANVSHKERPVDLVLICDAEGESNLSVIPFKKIINKVDFEFASFFPSELIYERTIKELSKYNKEKLSQSKKDDEPIIWAGANAVFFTCVSKGEKRELRLDEIVYKRSSATIYWKSFCFEKKSRRTFKESSLGEPFIWNDKEYSLIEFYQDVLGIDYNKMLQSL